MVPRLRKVAIARRTHDVGLLASISTVNYARAKAYVAGDDARVPLAGDQLFV